MGAARVDRFRSRAGLRPLTWRRADAVTISPYRSTELICTIRLGSSPMKLAFVTAATCCCALSNIAQAESCDQRYPGSCRIEVSTTIVRTKGDTTAITMRSSHRMKRARPVVTGPASIGSVPLPQASPLRTTLRSASSSVPLPPPSRRGIAAPYKPTAIVDSAFNILTLTTQPTLL